MDVLKPIKDDPDNPFGSLIKEGINDPDNPTTERGGQSYYYDKNGKKQLSLSTRGQKKGLGRMGRQASVSVPVKAEQNFDKEAVEFGSSR